MAQVRGDADLLGRGHRLPEEAELLVGLPAVRLIGHRQVGEDTFHADQAALLIGSGGTQQLGPPLQGAAVAAQTGVDLQMHMGRSLKCRGSLGHGLDLPAGDAQRDVPVHRGGEIGIAAVQPGEDGRLDPGLTQLEGLGHVSGAQPVGAAVEGRLGSGERAVAVAVGLDRHHDLGRRDRRSDGADVMPDRSGVDDRCALQTLERAAGRTHGLHSTRPGFPDRGAAPSLRRSGPLSDRPFRQTLQTDPWAAEPSPATRAEAPKWPCP